MSLGGGCGKLACCGVVAGMLWGGGWHASLRAGSFMANRLIADGGGGWGGAGASVGLARPLRALGRWRIRAPWPFGNEFT